MALRFRVRARPPDGPLGTPGAATRLAEGLFGPAIEEATLLAEREIKDNTPVGATEVLRGSVQSATEVVRGLEGEFRGAVVVGAAHGVPVNEGSRPHWARRTLGDERAAYAVQHHIAMHGTQATRFFDEAVARIRGRTQTVLDQASAAYRRQLGGRT